MIGIQEAVTVENVCTDSAVVVTTSQGSKKRFPLAEFNRKKKEETSCLISKKLELDTKILDLKNQISAKEEDFRRLEGELHSKEEKLRRRKRKLDEIDGVIKVQSTPKVLKSCSITSTITDASSEKLSLSRNQFYLRKQKTISALRPIHCGTDTRSATETGNIKPVLDGLWTTLISTSSDEQMKTYIEKSNICTQKVIPKIVNQAVKQYEKSDGNKTRSIRTLYEGGLISSRKYTRIRNCSDAVKDSGAKRKAQSTEFMQNCRIPKLLPYKALMSFIRSIDIGEVKDLETIAIKHSLEPVPGTFRPLLPFLLCLADLYLFLHSKVPCLHWFDNKENVFLVAIGADGAPFGRDDTATAYLVSFLNVLKKVLSCDENYLLMGSNCSEDHPVMKKYTECLSEEMEQLEGKSLSTPNGHNVIFNFELIPADMKWVATMSGELNNCSQYFSSFANVNQLNKGTIGGSIGVTAQATWKPWDYAERLNVVKKVEKFKATPKGSKRAEVTKFIGNAKSRQEYTPPLGKYVNIVKAEPLHVTNNAWQHWFTHLLSIVIQYTDSSKLKSATSLSDMPDNCTLVSFLKCLKGTAKAGRLYKAIGRWFSDHRKKGVEFSYRFTGADSKKMSWHFAPLIQVLLKVPSLSKGSLVKLLALFFIALKLRDAAALYSRVEISNTQVKELENLCQRYFTACKLMLEKVNPTIWTLGYAIPYHTRIVFDKLGYGLGLNSMQGREAKHIKLAKYIENTCNVSKHLRWTTVFRHEYVSLIWLRENDPYHRSAARQRSSKDGGVSYIPEKVQKGDSKTCICGLVKFDERSCPICASTTMAMIKESIEKGRCTDALKNFCNSENEN